MDSFNNDSLKNGSEKDASYIFTDDDFEISDYSEDESRERLKSRQLQEKNLKYLKIFKQFLEQSELQEQEIKTHLRNIEYYLNTFLALFCSAAMPEGMSNQELDDYFEDVFIRKYWRITAETLHKELASIKLFYRSMADNGLVSEEAFKNMVKFINKKLPKWEKEINA